MSDDVTKEEIEAFLARAFDFVPCGEIARIAAERNAATARAERAIGDVDMLQKRLSKVEEERDGYKAVAMAALRWSALRSGQPLPGQSLSVLETEHDVHLAVDAARAAGLLTDEDGRP